MHKGRCDSSPQLAPTSCSYPVVVLQVPVGSRIVEVVRLDFHRKAPVSVESRELFGKGNTISEGTVDGRYIASEYCKFFVTISSFLPLAPSFQR